MACSRPQPGPDKTVAGAVLGAGWGAGAGAVIGNQVSYAGEGAAIGAGFGAISGGISGYAYDSFEQTQIEQEEMLASLKIQNQANARELEIIQHRLDRSIGKNMGATFHQVYFDSDATSLKAGSVANLEVIAETIKSSPRAGSISVVGHSDDAGSPEYNSRLAEARARTVSAYLGERGISMDQIEVKSYGSTRPIASNSTPVGRQLNRRVDVYVDSN